MIIRFNKTDNPLIMKFCLIPNISENGGNTASVSSPFKKGERVHQATRS